MLKIFHNILEYIYLKVFFLLINHSIIYITNHDEKRREI